MLLLECPSIETRRRITLESDKIKTENFQFFDVDETSLDSNEQIFCQLLDPASLELQKADRAELFQYHVLHNSDMDSYIPHPNILESICKKFDIVDNHQGDKTPLPTVHGTPGLGKSSLLDYFASSLTEAREGKSTDLMKHPRDWPTHSFIVSITFANMSPEEYVVFSLTL